MSDWPKDPQEVWAKRQGFVVPQPNAATQHPPAANQEEDTGSINKDEPRWPQPEPKQYALLHHAVALADQLEAAGLPEGELRFVPHPTHIQVPLHAQIVFWTTRINVFDDAHVTWSPDAESPWQRFRVGDPLPPELIAAIKATEDADA